VEKSRTPRRDFEGPAVGARRAAVEANRRNGNEPANCDRCGAVLLNRTSQRLAHRIVKELKKAFRGRASYHWDERDGSLYAVWERDD
jgi:hypothetical protein